MTTATTDLLAQPSLFDRQENTPIQTEPTKQELLICLETLFQAIEDACDLPEVVRGVGLGVAWQKSRAEEICRGYEWRSSASDLEVARMIASLWFKARVPYPANHWVDRMQKLVDRNIVSQAWDVDSAWYRVHPQTDA